MSASLPPAGPIRGVASRETNARARLRPRAATSECSAMPARMDAHGTRAPGMRSSTTTVLLRCGATWSTMAVLVNPDHQQPCVREEEPTFASHKMNPLSHYRYHVHATIVPTTLECLFVNWSRSPISALLHYVADSVHVYGVQSCVMAPQMWVRFLHRLSSNRA